MVSDFREFLEPVSSIIMYYHKILLTLLILSTIGGNTMAHTIITSRVFVIPIGPEMFNWNSDVNQAEFSYQASLINAPDLPPWIHYTYSNRYRRGFLYGAAPKEQGNFQLEIVGLNRRTFDTSYRVLDMIVQEKENITKYEVYLKIDNLNIDDTFNASRMEKLLNVFRTELWTEAKDLYITYLTSAVEEGARLPLNPNDAEGVVLKLGSSIPFSTVLNDFEEQLKPLRKRSPCPKDYKRTSKENLFRQAGFLFDWCSFKLISDVDKSLHQESARRGPNMNVIARTSLNAPDHVEWRWARPTKSDVPTRHYLHEIVTTVFIPTTLLMVLAFILSTTFCFHHEKTTDPESDKYFRELFNVYRRKTNFNIENMRQKRKSSPVEDMGKNGVQMVQYATSERGTLRSLSAQPSSPSDSLLRSPRAPTVERCNPYVRPDPPPYMGPPNIGALRVDF